MLDLLDHEDPSLRSLAVFGLGGEPQYRPLIVRAVADPSALVVTTALRTLGRDDVPPLFDQLVEVINRADPDWAQARREASRLLGATGEQRAWAEVVAAAAATGLGQMGGVDRLIGAHPPVPDLVPDLIALLEGSGWGREGAAFVLGQWRSPAAVPALTAVLHRSGSDHLLAVACIVALAKIGSISAEPALAEAAVDHPAPSVRAQALLALEHLGAMSLVDVALKAADDFDPQVRERAIRVLAGCRLGDERAVPTLAKVFRTTPDRRTRHLAGRALASCARDRISLGLQLDEPHPSGQRTALTRATCWVLGEIGDRSATAELIRALTHRDEFVRARAATALGKLANPEAAEPLHRALADHTPRVRASAATALGRLAVREATAWLTEHLDDQHPGVRAAARAAIARLHQR